MPIPSDWSQNLRNFAQQQNPREYWVDPFPNYVLTEEASSWEDFLLWLKELNGSWGFRGQREAGWGLTTSLDRAVKVSYSSQDSSGLFHLDREKESLELLFRFQQQAHHYIRNIPSSDDLSSWFALMQHHGVPTRLLDWTNSAYVAMYFAVEEEPQEENKFSAVWAIDLDWLELKQRDLVTSGALPSMPNDLKAKRDHLNRLLGHTDQPAIVRIDPFAAPLRMAAQQGFFLCKLYHQATFDQILMTMMIRPETPDRPVVRKLILSGNCRIKFLKRLREMNLHRASLFPGLDGFGQSLRRDLEIKVGEEAESAVAASEPFEDFQRRTLEGMARKGHQKESRIPSAKGPAQDRQASSRAIIRAKPMTAVEVFELTTSGGASDFVRVIELCSRLGPYCLIGGLAVNCFVDPVYTLDADLVLVSDAVDVAANVLADAGFTIQRFPHSLNAQAKPSQLRIQFTLDERYQAFVNRSTEREVLGTPVQVAQLEDIVQGKLWAWSDPSRRLAKRKKDELDLIRLAEAYPDLVSTYPPALRDLLAS